MCLSTCACEHVESNWRLQTYARVCVHARACVHAHTQVLGDCVLLTVRPWASCLTPLCLSFLVDKVGIFHTHLTGCGEITDAGIGESQACAP